MLFLHAKTKPSGTGIIRLPFGVGAVSVPPDSYCVVQIREANIHFLIADNDDDGNRLEQFSRRPQLMLPTRDMLELMEPGEPDAFLEFHIEGNEGAIDLDLE